MAGVGAADPGLRQPGQLGGRGLPQRGRPPPVGGGPPQVSGQRGQRQPAQIGPGDVLDLDLVAGQLGQEPGRALVAVLPARGGHHQRPAGARRRDIEQPALLAEQLGGERGGSGVGPGGLPVPPVRRVHQLVHAEQR